MSEANRDAAEQCAAKAAKALREGDMDAAIRLFEKSLRLFDNDTVRAVLERARRTSASGAGDGASGEGDPSPSPTTPGSAADGGTPGLRQRRPAASAPTPATDGPARPRAASGAQQRSFTAEQAAAAKRVIEARDFYAVLGVEKDANDVTIKKAYRSLALSLHPDKNAAPKAEEAFKRVSKAYSALSDRAKRTEYDHIGDPTDNGPGTPSGRGGGVGGYAGGGGGMRRAQWEAAAGAADDPFNVFRAFFGEDSPFGAAGGMGGPFSDFGVPGGARVRVHHFGGVPMRRAYQQQPQAHHQQQGDPASQGLRSLLNLLPMLLVLLWTISMGSGGGSSEPAFSVFKDEARGYTSPLATQNRFGVTPDISYYVKPDSPTFVRLHSDGRFRASLERQVEGDAYREYGASCRSESRAKTTWESQLKIARTEGQKQALQAKLAALDAKEASGCKLYQKHFGRG